MKICIIDDDKVYQMIMKKIITKVSPDTKIHSFYNGLEAINYFKETAFDCCHILLVDINMPKMNGWDFLDTIRKHQENYKIYLASSSIAYSDREKAKEYSYIEGFLTKPIKKEKISEIIKESNQ